MFGSLFKIAESVVTIVAAPVKIVTDIAEVVIKPVADAAEAVAKTVEEVVK